jgi:hypothetical protein
MQSISIKDLVREKKSATEKKSNRNFEFEIEHQTGEGSSAGKICSTPKSRLLNTVRADAKKNETA